MKFQRKEEKVSQKILEECILSRLPDIYYGSILWIYTIDLYYGSILSMPSINGTGQLSPDEDGVNDTGQHPSLVGKCCLSPLMLPLHTNLFLHENFHQTDTTITL